MAKRKEKWFTNLLLCKTIAPKTQRWQSPLTLIDAIAAAKAIVAMANAIQANTICALCAILITVICKQNKCISIRSFFSVVKPTLTCAFELVAQLIGTKKTILIAVAYFR